MKLFNLMNDYKEENNYEDFIYSMDNLDEFTHFETTSEFLASIDRDFSINDEYYYTVNGIYYSLSDYEMREMIIEELDNYMIDYIIDNLHIEEYDEYEDSLDYLRMTVSLRDTIASMNYARLNYLLDETIYKVQGVYYL